jgi:dipeptidyl-peptidase 4
VQHLAEPDGDAVTWGLPDFIAAEELNRYRGWWWTTDSSAVLAVRADESPVARWWVSDPSRVGEAPTPIRYPAAGTDNALVSLWRLGLDGSRRQINWDSDTFEYLDDVRAQSDDRVVLVVRSRDQRTVAWLRVGPDGTIDELHRDTDDAWVDTNCGWGFLDDGRLVYASEAHGRRRAFVNNGPITPVDWNVRSIVMAAGSTVVVTGNSIDHPWSIDIGRWANDTGRIDDADFELLTDSNGVYSCSTGWGPSGLNGVIRSASIASGTASHRTMSGRRVMSHQLDPDITPNVRLLFLGPSVAPAALVLPRHHTGETLPVLLNPYGGPHASMVVASRNAHLTSQWFADQGMAVLTIDGRGTPGLGAEWERAVHNDFGRAPVADQINGLLDCASQFPELDLARVAIRGWSFGGYLAAMSILTHPEHIHAAIVGAPVTEWRLYDTGYTERYLGDPRTNAAAYDRSSVLPLAGQLERPVLLVHGTSDDNVVVANTLQLSNAFLAAGKPHETLILSGVSHMTPQPHVAENLLLHQLDFLRRSLKF